MQDKVSNWANNKKDWLDNNIKIALVNENENWMLRKLEKTGLIWIRQYPFHFRFFDFYNKEHKIVVEVDGEEHDVIKDGNRDAEYFNKFDIVTLRVRNRNESDAGRVMSIISNIVNKKPNSFRNYSYSPIAKVFEKKKTTKAFNVIKKPKKKDIRSGILREIEQINSLISGFIAQKNILLNKLKDLDSCRGIN